MLWDNDAQKGKSPSLFCESWEKVLHFNRWSISLDTGFSYWQLPSWSLKKCIPLSKVVPVFRTEVILNEVWLISPVWPAVTLNDWLENFINIWHCDFPYFQWTNVSLRSYPKQRKNCEKLQHDLHEQNFLIDHFISLCTAGGLIFILQWSIKTSFFFRNLKMTALQLAFSHFA